MQKWKKWAAAVVAAGMLSSLGVATALEEAPIQVDMKPDFSVMVDMNEAGFQDANGAYVYPIVYQGSTYLPLRAVGKLMGMEAGWDAATKTVTLDDDPANPDGTYVEPQPETSRPEPSVVQAMSKPDVTVIINGESTVFTDANGKVIYPIIYNGTTYLPLRAIGNIMEMEVGWNAAGKIVFLGQQPTEEETQKINFMAQLIAQVDAAQEHAEKADALMDVVTDSYDDVRVEMEGVAKCMDAIAALETPDYQQKDYEAVKTSAALVAEKVRALNAILAEVDPQEILTPQQAEELSTRTEKALEEYQVANMDFIVACAFLQKG
ncbi:MAG: copper amine oxidase N-terminal domain-containing protein [Eubacteriales bacterium]|jgi:hypothetical protein